MQTATSVTRENVISVTKVFILTLPGKMKQLFLWQNSIGET